MHLMEQMSVLVRFEQLSLFLCSKLGRESCLEIWQGIYYHLAGVIFYSRFIFFPSSAEKDSFLHTDMSQPCPAQQVRGSWWCWVKNLSSRAGWKSYHGYSCSQDVWCLLLPCSFSSEAALALQAVIGVQGGQIGLTEPCAG